MTRKYKEESYRQQRVASLINNALVECFARGKMLDLRLMNSPITITAVKMNKDLRTANCCFVPFNTEYSVEELSDALHCSRYAIRSFVTNKVALKYSPEIRFWYDKGFQNALLVDEYLKRHQASIGNV